MRRYANTKKNQETRILLTCNKIIREGERVTNLKLHENIVPEKLIKAGFKRQSENKMVFRMREKLYKDAIHLSLKINLSRDTKTPLEWHIIDANTGLSYNAFYFTPNTCKDLVRETTHITFDEIINGLNKREILYEETNNENCKI